jgi:hypothetical protein
MRSEPGKLEEGAVRTPETLYGVRHFLQLRLTRAMKVEVFPSATRTNRNTRSSLLLGIRISGWTDGSVENP